MLGGMRQTLEAVLKTRTAFEKLSNQPPDASQNAPYHRYIHPICLIFYFCFRAYNNFKTASKEIANPKLQGLGGYWRN